MASHSRDCTTCVKSGECKLQELAHRMGVMKVRLRIRKSVSRWITVLIRLSVIRINVYCAATVSVSVRNYRVSELWELLSGGRKPWLCRLLIRRSRNGMCCMRTVPCILSHWCNQYSYGHGCSMEVWLIRVRVVAQVAPAVRVAVGCLWIDQGTQCYGKNRKCFTESDLMRFTIPPSVRI